MKSYTIIYCIGSISNFFAERQKQDTHSIIPYLEMSKPAKIMDMFYRDPCRHVKLSRKAI